MVIGQSCPTFTKLLDFAQLTADRCLSKERECEYSHANEVSQNVLRFNCYGFIGHLLQEFSPPSYQAIVQFMQNNIDSVPASIDGIPCPFNYAAFFSTLQLQSNPLWIGFEDFKELLPGDFLVYLPCGYIPQEIEKMPTARTGMHIMVVEKVVSMDWNQTELVVIDCTRRPHCRDDQRKETGGIGRSPLTIHIEFGKVRLQWGKRKTMIEKDLFCGRLRDASYMPP